jgi:hypothetical protein
MENYWLMYKFATAWEGTTLSSTLIMETTHSSAVTVKSFQIKQCLIPEQWRTEGGWGGSTPPPREIPKF